MKIEWLVDNGEIYVGVDGCKLYANGIVNARYKLNSEAYEKLAKSVARALKRNNNKRVGYAII